MIGQIVNYRYEVLEKIGDGALFSVYRSRDKVLNRLVTLKILRPELAETPGFSAAVREGYRAVSNLDHPNIARVLEADPETGDAFVALEHAHGISVKERIRRAGSFQAPLALDIIICVLEALEYAHANRVIHGDLRPQDVIVGSNGEVKVTDFGISSALARFPDISNRFPMRSVNYQAPETAEGAPPSAASDVYSVGVMLYEMLTATLPFDGATAVAVALKQAREVPVPPRSVNTAVPKSLSDLIMRAIEKQPADRFQSASAMLADLRAIRDALRIGRPLSVPQPVLAQDYEEEAETSDRSLRKSLILLMGLFVLVMLISLGVTMYLVSRHGEMRDVRVPDLVGKTLEEATYLAQKLGLRVEEDGEVYSDSFEAGTICSATPMAGTMVARDTVLRVKLSRGPSRKQVPDLEGVSESDAYKIAVENGFTIGKVTRRYHDTAPIGTVVSQSPGPGEMQRIGSSISLVVSTGPKPTEEPTLEPGAPAGEQRKFDVAVEVPREADGAQEVRIVVEDDRGEITAYQSYHQPGDKFTAPITTYGPSVRIRVYVGDELASDARY